MCLTSDKPIEIKVVTDKPMICYKILVNQRTFSHVSGLVWLTPHRYVEVVLGELTKKSDGPGLPIKYRDSTNDYIIEEGLHGYLNIGIATNIMTKYNIHGQGHKVMEMELPIGTNYAIGKDNGEAPAIVADRAIYREIKEVKKKVKKWKVKKTFDLESNSVLFNNEEDAQKYLYSHFIVTEVEVDGD